MVPESTPKITCSNCQKKNECPLKGNCLHDNVIYQATVTTENNSLKETYVGLATNFKERCRNHKASFTHAYRRNETELSKLVWTLKENNSAHRIEWRILRKCSAYSNTSKKCNLCLYEKFIIICKPELCSLNKRNELVSTCRHAKKYLLRTAT